MTIAKLLLNIRPVELAEVIKAALGISYREVRIGDHNMWIDPASNFGNRVVTDGMYEPDFTSTLLGLLKPGDHFVDLGANEGWFSLLASKVVGPAGRVYVIEPQARLWPVIHQNFILNQRRNYTLIPYAVGEKEGFIELALNPSLNSGASTAVPSRRRKHYRHQKVGVMPLAKLMESYGISTVAVLKVDIEGFELNALRSLGKRLSDGSIHNILLEVHPMQLKQLGQTIEQIVCLLTDSGYKDSGAEKHSFWTRRA